MKLKRQAVEPPLERKHDSDDVTGAPTRLIPSAAVIAHLTQQIRRKDSKWSSVANALIADD